MWNYKLILTTMQKNKDKWDHWHQKSRIQNIQTYTVCKGWDCNLHWLNRYLWLPCQLVSIPLFWLTLSVFCSFHLLPAYHFCCAAPHHGTHAFFPCSRDFLAPLIQVPATCLFLFSVILPISNMVNLVPSPIPTILPTAEKFTFSLFPSNLLTWVAFAPELVCIWTDN